MKRSEKYKKQPAISTDRVTRVMPLIDEFLDGDLMPLIKQVIRKRVELYLREANLYLKEIDQIEGSE